VRSPTGLRTKTRKVFVRARDATPVGNARRARSREGLGKRSFLNLVVEKVWLPFSTKTSSLSRRLL